MEVNKSLDVVSIIATLLHDAHALHGDVFNTRSLKLTLQKVHNRYRHEGLGFLTKTLRRLSQSFDQALAGGLRLTCTELKGFDPFPGAEFPRFLGEFFERIFHSDGSVLPDPDAQCVRTVRQILLPLVKYEVPYKEEQEQKVIDSFLQAEEDLSEITPYLQDLHVRISNNSNNNYRRTQCYWVSKPGLRYGTKKNYFFHAPYPAGPVELLVREARNILSDLFSSFDPTDIVPRHGPGAVSTRERLWMKYQWTNVSSRITEKYPFDAYFCASSGHVCDTYDSFDTITETDHSARVILVPKDSRGPRLISCEPVDFQWVQQGLQKAIYQLVESHELTKFNVFFTDQGPNQRGALLGSSNGKYATLDLKEASDRVHLDLVRLLFPEHVYSYLEACRSTSTVLPDGRKIELNKYAPMGSALCFPVLALTIWSLLSAGAPNVDTRESILVYGDDVIVPTAFAESAITILESFGLKINRDKSCVQGLFRESCGTDAFQGTDVTPVRLRTVWSESPSPDTYTSWIAYANSFYDRRCYATYELIVGRLTAIYGDIPDESLNIQCPSLRTATADPRNFKRRWNKNLQKFQFLVPVVVSPRVHKVMKGWDMLLRYFTEGRKAEPDYLRGHSETNAPLYEEGELVFSVSQYTKRHSSKLVRRWR